MLYNASIQVWLVSCHTSGYTARIVYFVHCPEGPTKALNHFSSFLSLRSHDSGCTLAHGCHTGGIIHWFQATCYKLGRPQGPVLTTVDAATTNLKKKTRWSRWLYISESEYLSSLEIEQLTTSISIGCGIFGAVALSSGLHIQFRSFSFSGVLAECMTWSPHASQGIDSMDCEWIIHFYPVCVST